MFGNAILDLLGNRSPLQRVTGPLAQAQPATAATTPAAPSDTPSAMRVVQGTAAPGTQAQPQAYQSPPQLMDLYNQLQERQGTAALIDTGIGLIANGLAPAENRRGILSAMSGAGGVGGIASANSPEKQMATMAQIMQLEQAQRQLERRAALRGTLPAIAQKHNLDENTVNLLFESGDLDKVLVDLSKPDNQIVELGDGTQAVINKRTGQTVSNFGPKRTENEVVRLADGRQMVVDKRTGQPVSTLGPRSVDNQFVQLANGQWAIADKYTGKVGSGQGPESAAKVTNEEALWKADNADRTARGLGDRSLSEFISQTARDKAGAQNFGPNNINYGEPPKDMAWKRNADGSIATNESGAPIAMPVVGSKLESERSDAAKSKESLDSQKARTSDVVNENIDRVLKSVSANSGKMLPLTGAASMIGNIPMATPHRDMAANLDTIRANIGFDKLQEMRAASPTGGALGQVSDFENKLLQSTFGSLDPTQSEEQFTRNLRRVQSLYNAVVHHGVKDEEAARIVERKADASAIPIDELLKKYGGK